MISEYHEQYQQKRRQRHASADHPVQMRPARRFNEIAFAGNNNRNSGCEKDRACNKAEDQDLLKDQRQYQARENNRSANDPQHALLSLSFLLLYSAEFLYSVDLLSEITHIRSEHGLHEIYVLAHDQVILFLAEKLFLIKMPLRVILVVKHTYPLDSKNETSAYPKCGWYSVPPRKLLYNNQDIFILFQQNRVFRLFREALHFQKN